jgi:hypothetical protein
VGHAGAEASDSGWGDGLGDRQRGGLSRCRGGARPRLGRGGSPILAVGGFVIDIVPQPFKEFAIATFGAYDKIALLVGLLSRC